MNSLLIERITVDYLQKEIVSESKEVVDCGLEPKLRELVIAGVQLECWQLIHPFIDLIHRFDAVSNMSMEVQMRGFSEHYEQFLSAHRSLIEKHGKNLYLCEWVASVWCGIMEKIKKEVRAHADSHTNHFLEDLHYEMTVSFAHIFKYYSGYNDQDEE